MSPNDWELSPVTMWIYTQPFKAGVRVPEEMLVLPAWWIRLWEHTAFRLSLSISALQDTTMKTNASERRDPEMAEQSGYLWRFNYCSTVKWRPGLSYTNGPTRTHSKPPLLHLWSICSRIVFAGDFHFLNEWLSVRAACQQSLWAVGPSGCIT